MDSFVPLVMTDVERFFNDKGHHPSAEMYRSLSGIPHTIESIVKGEALPRVYICPLDTGVGKSVTLGCTVRRLLEAGYDKGVLVCLHRYDEIADMVERMGLAADQYAVMVTEGREEREWGIGYANRFLAPVLFTTHAMVETRIKQHSRWADVTEFFYKDSPRLLRLWDEAFKPGIEITLNRWDFQALMAELKRHPFVAVLDSIDEALRTCSNHDVMPVPDFIYDFDKHTILSSVRQKEKPELSSILDKLFRLSGRPVIVRKDGAYNTMVQYEITFPDDFYPMLVTDASARVSEFYKVYEQDQRKVLRLAAAPKRYSNLTIHYEEKGYGKESYGQKFEERLQQIAELIRLYPDHRVLVLHHKEGGKIGNTEKRLMALLQQPTLHGSPAPVDVQFCSWGQHRSSNRYRDCDLVICASTYYPSHAYVEARARMAAGLSDAQRLEYGRERAMERGEVLSDLLQGLSRGSLRQLEGDEAKPCKVFLSAAKNTRLYDDLPMLFPDATIKNGWGVDAKPLAKNDRLTNQQEQLLIYLDDNLAQGIGWVPYQKAIANLGIAKASFSTRVVNEAFRQELLKRGWEVVKDGTRRAFEHKQAEADYLSAMAKVAV